MTRPTGQALAVGLTGGAGAGKSTVAVALAHRGATVVDADALAREVVAPGTPGHQAVLAAFGREVLAADGTINRAALAARVFSDAGERRRLEAIVHPLVGARWAEQLAAAPPATILVHDVPLLVEAGLARRYDVVVVVDVPLDVQRARLVARGLRPGDADARIAAQATRAERLAVADVVIDNSGDTSDLDSQLDRLWTRLLAAVEQHA